VCAFPESIILPERRKIPRDDSAEFCLDQFQTVAEGVKDMHPALAVDLRIGLEWQASTFAPIENFV
jgi:hypothetical protein